MAMLTAGPEIPGSSSRAYGGRSFVQMVVEVQKAMAQMSFDTKVVNREQSVEYGRLKADTIDEGADKIRKGAVFAFAFAAAGAAFNISTNIKGLGYASRGGSKAKPDGELSLESSALSRPSSVDANGGGGPSKASGDLSGTHRTGESLMGGAEAKPKTAQAKVKDSAQNNGPGPRAQTSDNNGGEAPDGSYVSPIMQMHTAIGAAGSTVLSGMGDIIDKHEQAKKMELDADGARFDTYAGEQSQFYSDANDNVSRALSVVESVVSQVYNTNVAIASNLPR